MISEEKVLLVGDNPFHGISHLSQERSRMRGDGPTCPEYAARLISTALENGANGFMFSISETTLSILKILNNGETAEKLRLYAILPYAYEYVRLASQTGGIPNLAKKLVKELVFSRNFRAMASGLNGILRAEFPSLIKTYLMYEISRIKSSVGNKAPLNCVLLHQLVTDMFLGFDMDWMFKEYVDFMQKKRITPGFNTGNFALLLHKLREWDIDLGEIIIAAPFNKLGFQMVPSKKECERALARLPKPNVIALSILAASYLKPLEAIDYIASLPNIKGVAVGVSKETHTIETFRLLKEKLK